MISAPATQSWSNEAQSGPPAAAESFGAAPSGTDFSGTDSSWPQSGAAAIEPAAALVTAQSGTAQSETAQSGTVQHGDVQAYAVQLGVDYGLDPRSISASRLRSFIVAAVMSAGSLILVVPMMFSSPTARWMAPILWLGLVALLAVRAWWWPAVKHRYISYRLEPEKLIIRRGVWWRSVAMVPRSRVQHTDVSQGPVERNFGLGTLIVYTAGTQFAAVPLSGLAHETATYIRDLLIDEPDGDDAV